MVVVVHILGALKEYPLSNIHPEFFIAHMLIFPISAHDNHYIVRIIVKKLDDTQSWT